MVCQRGVQPRLSHSLNRRLYTLKHTDYLLANYQNPAGDQINLYISYYESQRKGQAVHTPQSCVPGSGWMIQRLSNRLLDGITMAGSPLIANRMEIQKEDHAAGVYSRLGAPMHQPVEERS